MEQGSYIANDNPPPARKRRKFFYLMGAILFGALIIGGVARVSLTYERISENQGLRIKELEDEGLVPYKDPDRLNLLLLGLRGQADMEGGFLTDTMLVVSIEKSTGQAAFISIPRDLWIQMPGKRTHNKINEAYVLGLMEGGNAAGLEYAQVVATRVTGLAIDGVISADLDAVKEFIDAIGGVTVNLRRPFVEDRQWTNGGDMGSSSAFVIWKDVTTSTEAVVLQDGTTTTQDVIHESERWVFYLPAGAHTLDGATALYYVRARFTSSDFDRARRQHEVLVAARDRLRSLGVLLNPIKINELLGVVERHIVTDISLGMVPELAKLSSRIDASSLKHIILDTSESGYLSARRNEQGLYILEPRDGSFAAIRKAARDVFAQHAEVTE
ncbi:MAG: LCP family protein [bacterium]|nr:LCP family protein [bacterium]